MAISHQPPGPGQQVRGKAQVQVQCNLREPVAQLLVYWSKCMCLSKQLALATARRWGHGGWWVVGGGWVWVLLSLV
jgi:hypothetical protein